MNWILPLGLLILFELIADVFAKSWSLNQRIWFAVIALVAYLIANMFWLFALRNGSGLARGAMIFSLASAVIAVLLGYFIYKESINIVQIAGMILGIISLVLIFGDF